MKLLMGNETPKNPMVHFPSSHRDTDFPLVCQHTRSCSFPGNHFFQDKLMSEPQVYQRVSIKAIVLVSKLHIGLNFLSEKRYLQPTS